MEGVTIKDGNVGGTGTRDNNRVRPNAFTRGYNKDTVRADDRPSGNCDVKTQTDGIVGVGTSVNGDNKSIREVERGTTRSVVPIGIDAPNDTIDTGRSEQLESGSVGLSGSVDAAKRTRGTNGRFGSVTKNTDLNVAVEPVNVTRLVKEERPLDSGISITVEGSAISEVVEPEVREKKARVRKPKEPPRGKVEEVSASLGDIYQVLDMVTESAVKFIGKGELYPKDLMCLDDDVSLRLARSFVQLNDAMPKLAAKFNAVSVPVMLISTLATDLFGKGVMLYAIVKSPKVG